MLRKISQTVDFLSIFYYNIGVENKRVGNEHEVFS